MSQTPAPLETLDSLSELDPQGFSGWARLMLSASEPEIAAALAQNPPPWGERVGEGLLALCEASKNARVDEPLFARRALKRNKLASKPFQAACSIWSLSMDLQAIADADGPRRAPSLAMLALARVKLHPEGAALRSALSLGAERLPEDFANAPLLAMAFSFGLHERWFDPLFELSASWSVPKALQSHFRGASHLTHVAADAMARRREKAPLAWCSARESSFKARDGRGQSCVERVIALDGSPLLATLALQALAEAGAPFDEPALSRMAPETRDIIAPILLARSERLALGAQIALSEPEREAPAAPRPIAPKRL